MPNFSFNEAEILIFFAVLCRFASLFALMPIMGDRVVPAPVKVLLAVVVSIALFPALTGRGGGVDLNDSAWTLSGWGIVSTLFFEVVLGLVFGFVAKYAFEVVQFGSTFLGTLAGFSMSSQYDPHQESQTEVVSRLQITLAMLLFLVLEGHHLVIRSALESYKVVGLGKASLGEALSKELLSMTAEIFRIGLQLAAPIAVVLFAVNVVYGVMSKSMPQMNVLVLSFSVSTILGLGLMLVLQPEFYHVTRELIERMSEHLVRVLRAMKG